jgi:hypothetical protein
LTRSGPGLRQNDIADTRDNEDQNEDAEKEERSAAQPGGRASGRSLGW